MTVEKLSSRKNAYIAHLRGLAADGEYRRGCGEYVCDGAKLLTEALANGAELCSVLWKEGEARTVLPERVRQYSAPAELFDYASPMKNSPGPVFAVRLPAPRAELGLRNAIVLESVQDPGNVGTVIRTAAALGVDAVILCGTCADVYSPKTVRAAMGAVFRQRIISAEPERLGLLLRENGLPLYGAALTETAGDIRALDIRRSAVAVGSEGHGLSGELLSMCQGQLIIPMTAGSESLNAAVAAAVVMWEMTR